jgi:hypothetical protein
LINKPLGCPPPPTEKKRDRNLKPTSARKEKRDSVHKFRNKTPFLAFYIKLSLPFFICVQPRSDVQNTDFTESNVGLGNRFHICCVPEAIGQSATFAFDE